jgi:hypothetical protein
MSIKSATLLSLQALHRAARYLPAIGNFRPLRGAFTAKHALDTGILQGHLIVDKQTPGPCPQESMTVLAGCQQNDHQPWPVFWVRTNNARLVGKMLHWRTPEDLLCMEGVYHLTERRRLGEDSILAQIMVPNPKPLAGIWTSISSNWNEGGNYYHWMLDGLTRLAVRDELPEKPRILLPSNLPQFARETLKLLNLESDCTISEYPCIQPERYYFCSPTAMTGVWNPIGYQWLRKNFSAYFKKSSSSPAVFLTRRGISRVPKNLAEIESIFVFHGFEIIDCGVITVKEQIEKISSAPAVAGLHGAAMTNLLWALPKTPVLELFDPAYLNACYEQIAFHGHLHYTFEILKPTSGLTKISEWCEKLVSHNLLI